MDSTAGTLKHIKRVNQLLIEASKELLDRAVIHDESKLMEPEKSAFDEASDLKGLTFGSDEYKEALEKLGPALQHHYKHNPHHPQHYSRGIDGMNLFDIIEMFLDWKAAGERHENGDIVKSIKINAKRFEMSEQLINIFRNTADHLGWTK